MTQTVHRAYEEEGKVIDPKGFIGAYTHSKDALKFVSFSSEDPSHGYFEIDPLAVFEERHVKNLIVTNASKFMNKRMRPNTNYANGISYLDVGTGVGTGTTQLPQAENSGAVILRVPLTRKAITSWTCLDGAGAPTASDTNVLQLTTTFVEAEANGAIVEMGLFGGDSTATLSSGQMFNYKTFPVLNKDNTMQLTLVWKLTF